MIARRGVALGLLLAASACAPAATYPGSPQWRGGRFANPPDWPVRPGVLGFLRWRHARRPTSWVGAVPPRVPNDGAALRADRRTPSVTWIGHATLLVQSDGVALLTDPVFSDALGVIPRSAPPGVSRADLPPIDAVLISHSHRDHLDEDSVRALGPEVRFVVPLGLAAWFRARGLPRVTELDWWESTSVAAARVTLVPAQHWSGRLLVDNDQSLWGGYVIEAPAARFYFAGDTGYPAAFVEIGRRFPRIDYALLPIGAYEPRWFMAPQHIGPEEAVRAFRELGARALVPMHWGTFALADEGLWDPPRRLVAAIGGDEGRLIRLPIGGTRWGRPPE